MKILIDTNILIDFYAIRPDYYDDAENIFRACAENHVNGCIAAHSVMNAFYILRKDFTVDERKKMLKDLCFLLTVIGIDKEKIVSALENEEFSDVEDCLQAECADAFHADYIVTRNVKDFQNSKIPAILPNDFLEVVK